MSKCMNEGLLKKCFAQLLQKKNLNLGMKTDPVTVGDGICLVSWPDILYKENGYILYIYTVLLYLHYSCAQFVFRDSDYVCL